MTPYYEQDGITVYVADCMDVLPHLERVDHVITDPPYDAKTHAGARYGFGETCSEIAFAPLVSVEETTKALLASARAWVVAFCSVEMLGDYARAGGSHWVRTGFWRRINGVPQFTGDRPGQPGEGIAILHSGLVKKKWNGNGRHAFWEYPIVSNGPHPTTKPLPLMKELVALFTDPGDLILDPFAGSLTTAVAAKHLGRRCIAIEREERFAEAGVKRLAQMVMAL